MDNPWLIVVLAISAPVFWLLVALVAGRRLGMTRAVWVGTGLWALACLPVHYAWRGLLVYAAVVGVGILSTFRMLHRFAQADREQTRALAVAEARGLTPEQAGRSMRIGRVVALVLIVALFLLAVVSGVLPPPA